MWKIIVGLWSQFAVRQLVRLKTYFWICEIWDSPHSVQHFPGLILNSILGWGFVLRNFYWQRRSNYFQISKFDFFPMISLHGMFRGLNIVFKLRDYYLSIRREILPSFLLAQISKLDFLMTNFSIAQTTIKSQYQQNTGSITVPSGPQIDCKVTSPTKFFLWFLVFPSDWYWSPSSDNLVFLLTTIYTWGVFPGVVVTALK